MAHLKGLFILFRLPVVGSGHFTSARPEIRKTKIIFRTSAFYKLLRPKESYLQQALVRSHCKLQFALSLARWRSILAWQSKRMCGPSLAQCQQATQLPIYGNLVYGWLLWAVDSSGLALSLFRERRKGLGLLFVWTSICMEDEFRGLPEEVRLDSNQLTQSLARAITPFV